VCYLLSGSIPPCFTWDQATALASSRFTVNPVSGEWLNSTSFYMGQDNCPDIISKGYIATTLFVTLAVGAIVAGWAAVMVLFYQLRTGKLPLSDRAFICLFAADIIGLLSLFCNFI
jgi:hypothetical protein